LSGCRGEGEKGAKVRKEEGGKGRKVQRGEEEKGRNHPNPA
jgi:hypothetical protein